MVIRLMAEASIRHLPIYLKINKNVPRWPKVAAKLVSGIMGTWNIFSCMLDHSAAVSRFLSPE
jgi:hypothetical protein